MHESESKKPMSKKMIAIIVASGIVLLAAIIALVLWLTGDKAPDHEPVFEDPMESLGGYLLETDDYDKDGLTNDQEIELKTDPYSSDTDTDGLGDGYEINESKTNPLKKDTDGDTLSDYVELCAKLNPLEAKTDGETPDAQRQMSESYNANILSLQVNGNANIYNTYCKEFKVTGFQQTPGVASNIYEIYNSEKFEATIKFQNLNKTLTAQGLDIKDMSICRFTNNGKIEKVKESETNVDNGTVTATVTKPGKYLLCNYEIASKQHDTKIMILIDNSGSMYPEEMCEGSDENDVDFKRLDMANKIIDSFDASVEFGVGKFTGDYTKLADIGTDKSKLKEYINGIRDAEENFNGTFIATSIIEALESFTSDHSDDRKFIIILTDGATTENAGLFGWGDPTEYDAIDACKEKNVAVITIGLGNKVDTEYLKKISNETGGAYIVANNADALASVHNKILEKMVFSTEKIDDNNTYIVADTGFSMDKNALPFNNFIGIVPEASIRQEGFCYGMAFAAQAFYTGKDILSRKGYDAPYEDSSYKVPDFDIASLMGGVDNLRDVEDGVLGKYTAIRQVESKDRYEPDGTHLAIKQHLKDDYSDEYLNFTRIEKDVTWNDTEYTSYEAVTIDIEKYMAQEEKRDDMELACAMHWLWATQINTQYGTQLNEFSLNNNFAGSSNELDYIKLADKLSAGVPLIVSYSTSGGGHAINAIRLLRDVDDPSTYYLECYDNNDCNEPVYMKIEHSDMGLWSKTSVSNWGTNYSIRPYIYTDGEWENISLSFGEIK